jgi:hypothetical protein
MAKNLIFIFTLLLSFSCGNVKLLNDKKPEEIYSETFLDKLKKARIHLAKKDYQAAIKIMNSDAEKNLSKSELAMQKNFLGVIYFTQNDYEKALYHFNIALGHSNEDRNLTNQIYLNQASCYFRLDKYDLLEVSHGKIIVEALTAEEKKKFALLGLKLAQRLKDEQKEFQYLDLYLADVQRINELKSLSNFNRLAELFSAKSVSDKMRLIKDQKEVGTLALGYLGYKEIDGFYVSGEREQAKDLLAFLKEFYGKNKDLDVLLKNHKFVAEDFSSFEVFNVGVILPLTGPKSSYGKRSLLGIDFALKSLSAEEQSKINLIVRDSKGSGAVGSHQVKELIEKHKVSYIIGGLYPDESTRVYRECKKYGALFISLSQIHLDKELKGKLLLEVPGSVESQVATLASNGFKERFGKKAAILYSNDDEGEAYLASLWSESKKGEVELRELMSYEKNRTDYRDPVKKVLGLQYPRLRLEEFRMLDSMYNLEEKKNIKRMQTLPPVVDFDWVFIPSPPREALQIIPSFKYFDAFNLHIVGTPQWRSKLLITEGPSNTKIYFVDDDMDIEKDNFNKKFSQIYKSSPKVVEIRSFEAFNLGTLIMKEAKGSDRFELAEQIAGLKTLKGFTGVWELQDNLWIKSMAVFSISKGKIEKVY